MTSASAMLCPYACAGLRPAKRCQASLIMPISPVGRQRITAIRIRLYTVSCTPPIELPSQLCSSVEVVSKQDRADHRAP